MLALLKCILLMCEKCLECLILLKNISLNSEEGHGAFHLTLSQICIASVVFFSDNVLVFSLGLYLPARLTFICDSSVRNTFITRSIF